MGCSEFKNGCSFKIPFEFLGKKISDAQLMALIKKKRTGMIKGLELASDKKDGVLELDHSWQLVFKETAPAVKQSKDAEPTVCPKCKNGTLLKGEKAYGCSEWKTGCSFRLPFEFLGKDLTTAHIQALAKKGETTVIKGLLKDGKKINAKLKLNAAWELIPHV